MPEETILILGGARSGKSRHAQALADASGRERVFIATARAGDAEMIARIERHRQDRDDRWRLIEEPSDLVGALRRARGPDGIVLVDCLTFWLFNLIEAGRDISAETARLADEIGRRAGPIIFVSNEVGFGIVPATELGRRFRDEQGLLNQAMARVCEQVTLVVAGLPLVLKGGAHA